MRRYPSGGVAARRAGIADRVGQTRRVGVGGRLRDDLAVGSPSRARRRRPVRRARRHSAAMSRPPSRQRGPGEHPHAADPRRRVGDQPQHGHHVGDLGHGQQPGQPDHLDRHTAGGQRLGHRCGVGVAPHQHRRRRHAVAVPAGVVVTAGPHGRPPSRVRPRTSCQQRAADGARLRRRAGTAARAPPPSGAGPRPTPRWPGAAPAADCASWCAAPGWAPACRRRAGNRW